MANIKKSRKRSRNSKNFVALPVQGSVALGVLASAKVLSANLPAGNFTEDLYAISADIEVAVRGLTGGEGFPSSWGLAHSDYSDVEIEENLEVALLGPGTKIEQERLRRLVRKGGQFKYADDANEGLIPLDRSHRVPLKFVINDGFSLDIYYYNRSGAALTTGAFMEWNGTIYGRWIV